MQSRSNCSNSVLVEHKTGMRSVLAAGNIAEWVKTHVKSCFFFFLPYSKLASFGSLNNLNIRLQSCQWSVTSSLPDAQHNKLLVCAGCKHWCTVYSPE